MDQALDLLHGQASPFQIGLEVVRGQEVRVYTKAPANLRELWLSSAQFNEVTYLLYGEERVSFAAAHASVRRLAAFLVENGVAKGDRVAIAMRNYPEWVIAFWATQAVGAIVLSVNALWTGGEIEYALHDASPVVLIADVERYDRVCSLLDRTSIRSVVVTRSESRLDPVVVTWQQIMNRPDPATLPTVAIVPEDDSTILYTSGTTGHPKGAVGSHRNHITNVFNSIVTPQLQGVTAEPPTSPGQAMTFWTFPFFHIAGISVICVSAATGGGIITQYKFDAADGLAVIERERAAKVAGVPTVVRALLDHPDAEKRDLSCVSVISIGGAPVPPSMIDRIEHDFEGRVVPANGYGLTETSSAVIANWAANYLAKRDSVGLPMPVVDIRIVDDDVDVPVGDVGELWTRGPNSFRGYWGNDKATKEAFQDGWFRTGDAARVDDDGFVYIVDRIKDMVLRGGENVYCAEVEAAIHQHPAIAEVAVIGLPHDHYGEEVVAVVTLKPERLLQEAELQDFLDSRLAKFKIPSHVFFHPGELPRNAVAKVLKNQLRAQYRVTTS